MRDQDKLNAKATMGISGNANHNMMTAMLVKQVEREVEQAIKDELQPRIDKLFKKAAMEAVGQWNIGYREQTKADMLGTTEIMVKFVEEVIRTNYEKVVVTEVADGNK